MAAIQIPNVKDLYFEHKALMHIHGQPNVGSRWTLSDELEANGSSVPTIFGHGPFGHLGLLLTDTQYATLLLTP